MEKWIAAMLVIAALVVGGLGGSIAFPQTEEVVTEKIVLVDKPVVTEKIVEVTVVKEVPVVQPAAPVQDSLEFKALMAEYSALARKYEALTDEDVNLDDLALELEAIDAAKSLVQGDYKHLFLDGYKPSEVSFIKFYDEDATVDEVRRLVDGRYRDFDKREATFTVKVKYSDSDGTVYQRFDVTVIFDIDTDGEEDITVTVDEVA
jgi:hypothetical protein